MEVRHKHPSTWEKPPTWRWMLTAFLAWVSLVPKVGSPPIVSRRLNNVLMARVCKLCGDAWELDYSFGRPREYCHRCEPEGWKIVLPKHPFGRVKLRRLRPLMRS